MVFLLVVLLLFVFMYLNNRITSLEERLNGGATLSQPATRTDTPELNAYVPAQQAPSPPPAVYTEKKETGEETSARFLGWTGAIMLLLGVSFFLKYAFDNNWVGPTGQVAIGIIVGIVFLGLGQKLRATYLKYSDLLFGTGIGILYFAIYAGFAFYEPAVFLQPLAFMLMILVTALAMVIAVLGGTINIAILGVLGGFLTPVLLSTGENHLVTLSLYMIVLNLGVLGVSWFKKWLELNYLTFFGTVILFSGWMSKFYWQDPDAQLWMTFFFLTIFFVLFLCNSVLHHFVRKESSTQGDLALLTMNAIGYFWVCYSILEPKHHDVLGFFALIMAVIYFVLAYVAYTSQKHDRTLNLFLPGIAVVFISVAIPLQLSGYWISIAWLIESVVLVYVGLFLREKVIQIFGWLVLCVGMISMMTETYRIWSGSINNCCANGLVTENFLALTPVFNMAFFLLALGVFVLYVFAGLYAKYKTPEAEWKNIVIVFVVLANMLSVYMLTKEVSLPYLQDNARMSQEENKKSQAQMAYQGTGSNPFYQDGYTGTQGDEFYSRMRAKENEKNTAISVLWALYATLLLVIGFSRRVRALRILGLIFFFITMLKVLVEVWSLGQLYSIVSTLAVGVITLSAAFLYAKYKERLKDMI